MFMQDRTSAETLPAFGAAIRLLPRVTPLMRDQVIAPVESLPALGALIDFLLGVDSLV